jgi:hypothetical protein
MEPNGKLAGVDNLYGSIFDLNTNRFTHNPLKFDDIIEFDVSKNQSGYRGGQLVLVNRRPRQNGGIFNAISCAGKICGLILGFCNQTILSPP